MKWTINGTSTTMLCNSGRIRCSGKKYSGRCGPRLRCLNEGPVISFIGIYTFGDHFHIGLINQNNLDVMELKVGWF